MKTNAQRQAEFRRRMREQGFVPVQLWVPEDKKGLLKTIARAFCVPEPK